MPDLAIPDGLRATAVRWEGDHARAWLEELPSIVAAVTAEWDLELGPPFEPGGNISWVAPCRRRDDPGRLVLKVQLPSPESHPEAMALAAWGGRGAVRLHAHDAARCALLLERCDPGGSLHTAPDVEAAFDAAVAIAAHLHVQPPPGMRAVAEHADGWAALLEGRGRPDGLDPALWRLALDTIRQQARPDRRLTLVHGDLNPTNVLSSERGWLAIDPKPLVADPAWDVARLVMQLGVPDGRDAGEVVLGRLTRAAEALGLPRAAVALGTFVDTVSMASYALAVGDAAAARGQVESALRAVPALD